MQKTGRNSGEEPIDYMNHTMDALRYVAYSERSYNKSHPVLIRNDDGSIEYSTEPGNPISNQLEDWIKLRGKDPMFFRDEDDLFREAAGTEWEND